MPHSSGSLSHQSPQSLRSLTIKQTTTTSTDDPSLPSSICIIGWIRTARHSQSGTLFTIDDGTATINASFWANTPFEEEQAGLIEPGNLLKMIGSIRLFNNETSVAVSALQKIDDCNYVTYHFANVLQQCMYLRRELKRDRRPVRAETSADVGKSSLASDVLACYRNNQDEKGLHVDVVVKMLRHKHRESDIRDAIDKLVDDCYLFIVSDLCYKTTD